MTAEFIAEDGALKGLILALNVGEEWTFGRDPDLCNLVIEDPKVSRRHAICRLTENGYEVENLSESNPILINNHPVTHYILRTGDRIKIGGTVFRFRDSDITQSPFDDDELESISSEGSLHTHKEDELINPSAQVFYEVPPIPEEPSSPYETIFQEESESAKNYINFDLTPTSRFTVKVITGPNSGAEVALDYNRSYIIGTDTNVCDIVFHDLSISRQHAKLEVDSEGGLFIEDLGSRNGVLVDRERISKRTSFNANTIVTLGTSTFLVLDKEAPGETIVAPLAEAPVEKEIEPDIQEPVFTSRKESLTKEPEPALAGITAEKVATKPFFTSGALIVTVILAGIALLFGIGMLSLFESKDVAVSRVDYQQEINQALKNFPAVKYTYNRSSGRLFLLGHVSSAIDKNELLYNLQGLNFITGMDDNVVVDEYIWQEMNIMLAKNPQWKGISMHAPVPGLFVLTGYLKTLQEFASLTNYINLNFNYLDLLENKVVVEEQLMNDVKSKLVQLGFNGVTSTITNGNLSLTGYIPSTSENDYLALVQEFKGIYGIRSVSNFVVSLSPEEAIVDLSGKYDVTGFSKFGNININVVINGQILARGDDLDGMTITSIQPHTIFLEKDGLKYKIEYN